METQVMYESNTHIILQSDSEVMIIERGSDFVDRRLMTDMYVESLIMDVITYHPFDDAEWGCDDWRTHYEEVFAQKYHLKIEEIVTKLIESFSLTYSLKGVEEISKEIYDDMVVKLIDKVEF